MLINNYREDSAALLVLLYHLCPSLLAVSSRDRINLGITVDFATYMSYVLFLFDLLAYLLNSVCLEHAS